MPMFLLCMDIKRLDDIKPHRLIPYNKMAKKQIKNEIKELILDENTSQSKIV